MNKSLLPNILTFINLSLGIIAIISVINDAVFTSNICILAAAVIDIYDGKTRQKLNGANPLGKELDSLSDLVSFGVAPAVVAWGTSLSNSGLPGYAVLLVFPICGAYRLTRYNTPAFKNVYRGIPITAAGTLLTIDNLSISRMGSHTPITVVFMILLSYLMISPIKIRKI